MSWSCFVVFIVGLTTDGNLYIRLQVGNILKKLGRDAYTHPHPLKHDLVGLAHHVVPGREVPNRTVPVLVRWRCKGTNIFWITKRD